MALFVYKNSLFYQSFFVTHLTYFVLMTVTHSTTTTTAAETTLDSKFAHVPVKGSWEIPRKTFHY
jgi:hypothetical protein